VRNIFENLSQSALADQQQHVLTPRKPSKWDKPQKSADASMTTSEVSLDRETNHHASSDVDGEDAPVHGSSTVFVVEAELPPPAFTRNIVAKFRELEASGADKTVPLPPGSGTTTTRSPRGHAHGTGNAVSRTYQSVQHAAPGTDDDVADGCLMTKPSREAQNDEDRGRAEERSELRHQRRSSGSPAAELSLGDELPQEGQLTARITAITIAYLFVSLSFYSPRGSDGLYCFRLSFFLCAHGNS